MKKTALITGASRGIGKAIADELDSTGLYALLTPSREEMDLFDSDSIDKYFSKHNQIDVLVNNAGINKLKPIEDIDRETSDLMINVNLFAPLRIIKKVVPFMKKNGYGKIVNVSSIWGIKSKEYRTLYSMTKFGLNGITKSLSNELGPNNILINSICPGYVKTEMTIKNVPPADQQRIIKQIPLRRFAEPYEIAKFVRFLVSEDNSYISGQMLIIDGGFLA